MIIYNFTDYWWMYLAFTCFVLIMLFLDLGVFHKKSHEVSFKEASLWTVFWISLALIFNFSFYQYSIYKFDKVPELISGLNLNSKEAAYNLAMEFLTGFVIEKTLAVDNIFIFAVVFSFFSIPKIYQHRVLFWGILGALFFRAIFIWLGSYLMEYYAIVVFFGGVLILTGLRMFLAGNEKPDLNQNILIRIIKRIFPVESQHHDDKFLIKKEGKFYFTPLFLALVFIELTDIIFAVDSVPAIFSITKEPLIVFTSNIFAILGLRSMFFMLSGVIDRFVYIKYGLASVLVFVGLKMVYLNNAFNGKFPTTWSLAIIGLLIGSSIVVSIIFGKKDNSIN